MSHPTGGGAVEQEGIAGLTAEVAIHRDGWGIPHVRATTEHDAWLAMGFACAEDRLFQLEHDRRRATGRWAEVAGPAAVPADVLARRLGLGASARADVASMSPGTRDSFEAYAAGVNAFLARGPLPPELQLAGVCPEPWEPWHSVAAFKVRHVLMGVWQHKLADAILLARVGPVPFARLEERPPSGSPVTLPPG
ncbi:MAG: penicillin acylase family protein, partial [Acidimicrobiales bacterium]